MAMLHPLYVTILRGAPAPRNHVVDVVHGVHFEEGEVRDVDAVGPLPNLQLGVLGVGHQQVVHVLVVHLYTSAAQRRGCSPNWGNLRLQA